MSDVFGIGGATQGLSSIAASGIQAGATISAAHTQADAAKYAADQSYNAASQANQLQTNEFNTQQENLQPWLNAGRQGLGDIQNGLNNGQLNAWNSPSGIYSGNATNTGTQNYGGQNETFNAPTQFSFDASSLQNDPGYQFQLNQGRQTLQNAQSSTGISGGAAAKELERYAQDYAGTAYNTAYTRAQGTFNQNLENAASQNQQNFSNQFQAQEANIANNDANFANNFQRGLQQTENNYNVGQQNTTTNYNRMASLAGLGQTANAQLGSAGQQYANAVGYNTTNAAAQAGNYATQGANASAASYVGLGNNVAGTITSLRNLSQNYGNNGQSYAPPSGAQWATYDQGSTPGGYVDAYGNPIQ